MRLRLRDNARPFADVVGSKLRLAEKSFDELPSMLMVHGGPGPDHSVRPFFETLADIAEVLFVDQRGIGRSDPGAPDDWNLATWTDDLLDELPRIELPTLVLAGDSDPIIPAERSLELAGGLVKAQRVETHVIAEAGHVLTGTSRRSINGCYGASWPWLLIDPVRVIRRLESHVDP